MKQQNKKNEHIGFTKGFSIIIPLCLCAIFLAVAVISVSNDMYAFVKQDGEVTVNIDSAMDTLDFAKLLSEKGIVKNPVAFGLYLRSKGRDTEIPYLRGEWTLNTNMSYREIISEIF
ncbi:MAG: hypothetical protein IJ499_00085 [Clostridia bacterium]|nr:hypothetical protein [Clostridia bacterium]